jgi:hypothetical protein
VPFILLLVYFLEIGGPGRASIHAFLITVLAARIMHPIGMTAPEASARQFICRGASAILTWLILMVAAVLLLVRRISLSKSIHDRRRRRVGGHRDRARRLLDRHRPVRIRQRWRFRRFRRVRNNLQVERKHGHPTAEPGKSCRR